MLLREIDSLEWMIDGVCFEYGPRLPGLRRRRGLREGRRRAVARRPPVGPRPRGAAARVLARGRLRLRRRRGLLAQPRRRGGRALQPAAVHPHRQNRRLRDAAVRAQGAPAVRRQQGAAGPRLQQRLARAPARLRRVVARADDGGLADVLRRAAPLPRLPSRPFPRKPAVPRRHPYERFLSLFRHEVHYLRSGGFLWHGRGAGVSYPFFPPRRHPPCFPRLLLHGRRAPGRGPRLRAGAHAQRDGARGLARARRRFRRTSAAHPRRAGPTGSSRSWSCSQTRRRRSSGGASAGCAT